MTVVEEIQKLKQEKNAVILAHYYVRPEIQDIADYIGDSFYLSKVAVGLKEQTIVFCGVSFMGESAKVLNPEKTVLMPDMHADCAMAHMADADTIQKMRDTYEDLAVVCYISKCSEDRKSTSEQEYFLYSGQEPGTFYCRAGTGEELCIQRRLLPDP